MPESANRYTEFPRREIAPQSNGELMLGELRKTFGDRVKIIGDRILLDDNERFGLAIEDGHQWIVTENGEYLLGMADEQGADLATIQGLIELREVMESE